MQNSTASTTENSGIIKTMNNITGLFSKENYDQNLLNMLEQKFLQPKLNNFNQTFIKNTNLLNEYPYIFNKNFIPLNNNNFIIYPVSNNIFYEYDKSNCLFQKIEVNSIKETKYFFEHLDKSFFIENEFNEFNLNFLVDNVRASEDVTYENHIYLYYDSMEKFSLLLNYCDFEPLLENNKLVFLISEKEKSMYPIDFNEMFGIDYSSMEFQEVRPSEIKRIVIQNHIATNSGNDLFVESFDGHTNLLNICQSETAFGSYNKDITLHTYINIVNNAIDNSEIHLLPKKIDGFNLPKVQPFENNPEEFIKYFKIFEEICKKNNALSKKDWLCANYLAFFKYSNTLNNSRISPVLHHVIHFAKGEKSSYHAKTTYNLLVPIFDEFKYFQSYAHIRDPLVAIRGFLKFNIVKSINTDIFDFSMLLWWLFGDFKNNPTDLFSHKFENKIFIRFEDMKLNPKATLKAITQWLNIPYDKTLEICTFMGKSIYFDDETKEIKSGFSVYPMYPRDMYDNVFSKENIELLEKIYYPFFEQMGYKPMIFNGDTYKKLTQDDFNKMLKNIFNFEKTIYQNIDLNQYLTIDGNTLITSKLIELYRTNFYKQSINYKNTIIDMMCENKINIYPVLKPLESECINPIYENMASLPELDDINIDFINNSDNTQGKLYWITGLSGSGKTTIGNALYEEIKKTTDKVVYLDGDTWRKYVAFDVGYTNEERLLSAKKFSGLCHMLSNQGLIVIASTIAMFDEIREANRKKIENYVEIYVKVELDTLFERDQNQLYSSKAKNIVGIDIIPELPKNPDIIIENDECECEYIDCVLNKILTYDKS